MMERYYVKRPTGKIFGPFDQNAIKMMLKSNKLGSDAQVSTDKVNWQSLNEVAAFAVIVNASTHIGLASRDGSGGPLSAIDFAGVFDGHDSGDADNLPRTRSVDLPMPREAGQDLPTPRRDADLPMPRGAGQELPTPRRDIDLPVPRPGNIELPGIRGTALPMSRGGELPALKGANLPRPRDASSVRSDLPRPRHVDLPGPTMAMNVGDDFDDVFDLPASSDMAAATVSVPAESLPSNSLDDDLFNFGVDPAEDLFSAPRLERTGDLFSAPRLAEDSDDLFSIPSVAQDDDLFGELSAGDDGDDLFAAPGLVEESDELFGAPKQHHGSQMGASSLHASSTANGDGSFGDVSSLKEDKDDLFAMPIGMEEDSDDLFGAPVINSYGEVPGAADDLFESNRADDGDDFLSGDGGFSFLDESPAQASSDSWEDDLVGNEAFSSAQSSSMGGASDSWEDDLLGNSGPSTSGLAGGISAGLTGSTSRSSSSIPASDPFRPASSGPPIAAADPFRPASTGPRVDSGKAGADSEQTESQGKKRGIAAKIGLPVVAVLVLGGAGFAAFNAFSGGEQSQEPVVVKAVREGSVALDAAKPDNFTDYQQVIDSASGMKLSPENAGKLLAVEALSLIRYPDDALAAQAETRAQALLAHKDEPHVALGLAAMEARSGNVEAARVYLEPLMGSEDEELVYFAQLLIGIGEVRALEVAGTELSANEKKVVVADDKKGDGAEVAAVAEGEENAGAPAKNAHNASFVARAQTALRAAAALDSKRAAPLYWQARLEAVNESPDAAVEMYERAINADPTHVASRLSVGRRYYDRGDLNNATEHLQKLIGELSGSASNAERGEAHHLMGMVHQARMRSEEAIAMFTEALKIDTARTDTLRALAEEYERAKMYKEALNFFTTDQTLGQQDPEVMLGIVRSYMGLEQWQEAIAQLEQGQNDFPEDARFPFYLGQLNQLRGTFYDARKAFERAVEIDPRLLSAHAALAQLAWRIDKDVPRGEEHIKKLVARSELLDAPVAHQVADYYYLTNRPALSRAWNEEALRLDPNFWQARLALAKVLLEDGDEQRALTLLERARKEGVTDIKLSAYLADAYRQAGRFDQAIEEINTVIEEFPNDEEYIFIRGRIYFDRGNYDTAREDFNKAYELNPRFHDAYFYVGRTSFEDGDYANAKRIFRHVLDYQPNQGEFHFYMGRTFEEEDNLTQALESYRKATAVDSEYGEKNPTIYIRRGRILSKLGYTREGKRDVVTALELAPHLIEARLAMGESDYQEQNYSSAIKHFSEALAKNADNSDAQYRLGMSYIHEGKRSDGARHLQLAIRYGYSNPDIYRTLGYLYKELGQSRQASDAFKSFIRETSDKPIADSIRKEMLHQITELGG